MIRGLWRKQTECKGTTGESKALHVVVTLLGTPNIPTWCLWHCLLSLLEAAIRRWAQCSHEGSDVVFKWYSVDTKDLEVEPRRHSVYTTTSSLNPTDTRKAEHGCMQLNSRTTPGNIFKIFCCPVLVSQCCSLSFLFSLDRSGTWCCPLLL